MKVISKERIDELLIKRAKIYGIGKQGNVFCLGLKFRPETLKNKKWLEHKYEVYGKFFETKEEAEWHKEFGCITRTEKLELPTWEEFRNKKIKQLGFMGKDTICFFELYEDEQKNRLILLDHDCDYEYFNEEPTKENYITACRLCKEFFLGGGDGDIR